MDNDCSSTLYCTCNRLFCSEQVGAFLKKMYGERKECFLVSFVYKLIWACSFCHKIVVNILTHKRGLIFSMVLIKP